MQLSDEAKAALSKVVESSANALADTLDGSGKLVKDNIKELSREVIIHEGYINYGLAAVVAFGVECIIAKAIMLIFDAKAAALVEAQEFGVTRNFDHGIAWFGIIVLFVVGFGVVCWFSDAIASILKARFAPRLFLTQYAASILKPKK